MRATNTPTLLRSSRALANRLAADGDLTAYALVQELCNRLEAPIHLGACLTDGMLHMTTMRYERGQVTILAVASIHEDHLRNRDCVVEMEPPEPDHPKTWKLPPGEELWDAAPGCDHDITSGAGGGIKCVKCRGWFCY